MASAPENTLPLFYQDLMPLNSRDHAKWRSRPVDSIKWLINQHAVPLTVEEFAQAQRFFPIVFSGGDSPVPLALMGLNEGVNTYITDEGKMLEDVYIPAYARRYPFLLARLSPQAEDLSLCFDPTSDAIGDFSEGDPLFDEEGKPAPALQAALSFCEQFEEAGAKTQSFLDEIAKHELLMEGEIAITRNDQPENPYVYRGFKMVDEKKLRSLDAETARAWNENGILALLYAHLFSMEGMRMIFARQASQGKVPELNGAPAA